ncbi:MAG: hypothetical protein R3D00_28470 [Bacteroidia bacterium]
MQFHQTQDWSKWKFTERQNLQKYSEGNLIVAILQTEKHGAAESILFREQLAEVELAASKIEVMGTRYTEQMEKMTGR